MGMQTVRRWAGRGLLVMVVLVMLLLAVVWWQLRGSLAQLDGSVRVSDLAATVTVARDERGVPMISGSNRNDIAFATGFVHAQERFFQMDLLRRVGGGELSELFGAKALNTDRAHRLHRFRARAQQMLARLDPAERAFLERYVSGVNAGLGALHAAPFEYALIGVAPRPWTAADSMLVVWAMYFDLQGNLQQRELARGWIAEHTSAEQRAFLLPESSMWDAALDGEAKAVLAPIPATAPSWWGLKARAPVATTASADFTDSVGSNNWAVAGSRSADGAAIVADDMHLGHALPNIWYRLALRFPDAQGKERRIVGVTLPGAAPTVIVGSNGHVAWGYTNSYGDYLDLIALGTDRARPGQLRTPAGWETPVLHTETILVKGGPAEKLVVRDTSAGPVRDIDDVPHAVRWIAHDPGALNLNPKKLELATTLDEALAIANTLGIPAQNFVGGDASGNIGWTIAGRLPRRAAGGAGATFPLAADGTVTSFDGILAPEQYPRVVNPANGQLSTANSRQLLGEGAALIGDGGFDIGARNRQVRDGLTALGPKTNVAGAYAIALDDRALFIAPWRDRALAVLDGAATQGHPARTQFRDLLQRSWTGRASIDSVGYRLARHFMWSLHDELFGMANADMATRDPKATLGTATSRWPAVIARLLDAQPAGWLPPGRSSWREVQLAAIDRVIADLTRDGVALADASWGERNRANIAHPIAAAVPALRNWLSAPADAIPGDAHMPRVAGPKHGQSQRMTVSPGREEQGIYNMPGGQSGHPLSPFFLNGHAEWVAGTPTPLLPGPAKYTLTFTRQ